MIFLKTPNPQIRREILNNISTQDYQKGLVYSPYHINYYGSNRLPDGTLFKFFVHSQNSDKNYRVNIEIDKNIKIKNLDCTCEQFKKTGSCKHLAASLIRFDETIFADNSPSKMFTLTNRIFSYFDEPISGNKKEAKLEIEFCLSKNYYTRTIVKIGDTRLYTSNNKLINLFNNLDNNVDVLFGKNFTYNSKEYYFNNTNIKIINYFDSIKNSIDNFSNIVLNERSMKGLLNIIKETSFIINGKTIDNIISSFPFAIYLNKINDDYELTFDINNDFMALTADNQYIYYKDNLYYLNKKQADLLEQLQNYETNKLIFKKDDVNLFSKSVLPLIKENIKLNDNVDFVISSKPTVKLYFDLFSNEITCKVKLYYDNIEIDYFDKSNKILRDIEFEQEVINDLLNNNFNIIKEQLIMDDLNNIGEFLDNNLAFLSSKYETYTSEKLKNVNVIKKANVKSTFSIGKDNIMSYSFNLDNILPSELDKIFESIKTKKKYYRLKSGDLLNLDENNELKQLNNLVDDIGLSKQDIKCGSGYFPKYQALYLDSLKNDKYSIIKTDNLFDEFINKFNTFKNSDITLSNTDLKLLRDYQVTGIKWLYNIHKTGFGGILADEMGLGKSIQTLFFIKELLKEDKEAKFLIVVPTSLAYNWENEILKFTPSLSYKIMLGPKIQREQLFKNSNENVMITTYGLLREDLDNYQNINFKTIFIDEAQNIKNPNTNVTKAVKNIKAESKFALTGTPIENSIIELWSIFDFIMPGFLASLQKFQSKYKIKTFDEDTNKMLLNLNKLISPFILRRKKTDVVKELPPKIENNIYLELSLEQKKLYVAELNKVNKQFENLMQTQGFTKSKFLILQLLTKLRQICIDPRILFEDYNGGSNKIETLIKVINEVVSNNHKVILFTSFKTALEIVHKELDANEISSYTIDGSISSKKRMELVDSFNNDSTNVFLIMLKSGGTGLNLTSADIVIHLDLWWNPQAENQATDRTHRIGQKKSVEVIKLICKGTIEEKILALQQKKKMLSDKLIESDNRDQNLIAKLNEKDIRDLLTLENSD
ncbi:MAG: DEAD/DEAH box helicase [Bacilli bacterium]